MRIKRGIGMLVAVVTAVGALAATPAMAATTNKVTGITPDRGAVAAQAQAPDDTRIPEEARSQIEEIPIANLRAEITKSLAGRPDTKSIQGIAIDYAPYLPEGNAAVARALPTGCGQASITFKNGNTIWNQVFSSCDGKSWSDLDYHLRLVRINPYNPYDTKIVKDSYPDMPAGSSTHFDQTITCRNASKTNWDGYAKGTMVLGGNTYTAESGDTEYQVLCGW